MNNSEQDNYMTIKIRRLMSKIVAAKKAYYEGNPTMSDVAYDSLEKQLSVLDPGNPVLELVGFDYDYELPRGYVPKSLKTKVVDIETK